MLYDFGSHPSVAASWMETEARVVTGWLVMFGMLMLEIKGCGVLCLSVFSILRHFRI